LNQNKDCSNEDLEVLAWCD